MKDIKKVAIVTPEFYGDTMVGGLAVSVHGLAHALKKKGIKVDVVMPAYKKKNFSEKFTSEPFLKNDLINDIELHDYSKDGIDIHKIVNLNLQDLTGYAYSPEVLNIDDSVYRESKKRAFEGCHLLSAAIPNALDEAKLDPDVIHLMEWTTAGASYYLRKNMNYAKKGIILTSHNLNYTGDVPDEIEEHKSTFSKFSELRNMRVSCLKDDQGNLFGSLLELGINYADSINTVSPTEAKEALNGREGVNERLKEKLKERNLEGILNGIDPTIINPEIDYRVERYHTKNYESIVRGKIDNKIRLNNKLKEIKSKFSINSNKILISMMCRLAEQKSINEVLEMTKELELTEDLQLLIVGEPANNDIRHKIYRDYNSKNKNILIHDSFVGPDLQHLILAASDAILQPSKWEPCGYTQLEGMAYGAIPIVTAVGGHLDTVKSFKETDGYGIFIDKPTKEEIFKAINEAKKLFNNKEALRTAVMNAVNEDFTWDGKRDSVGKYLKLYEQAMANRSG